MRRIALLGVLVAIPVLLAAAPAGACGGLVGENGTIQLTRTTTLAAYHDGVERYVTSFEFSGAGQGGRLDRAAARRADRRSSAAATGRCSGSSARSRRRCRDAAFARRRRRRRPRPQVLLETKIDALDITVLKGGGDAVGKWARRPRLPAHARRARGARLLRAAQPDLHGRALRRQPRRATLGQSTRRRHADHGDDPDATSRGCRCASSASVSTSAAGRRRRRVPAHRPAARSCSPAAPASSWPRSERGVDVAARRPALRQGHGLGARPRCGSRYLQRRHAGGRTSTTTSRCRRTPVCCRRHGWWASASPAVPRRRRHRRASRCGRSAAIVGRTARRCRPCSRCVRGAGHVGRRRREAHRQPARRCGRRARVRARGRRHTASSRVVRSGGASGDASPRVLGPGPVTVRLVVRDSHFSPSRVHVRPHTELTFEVVNRDFLNHEFIIGDDEVHARHEAGHEPYHPPKPGEVSIPPHDDGRDDVHRARAGDGAVRLPPPRPLRLRHEGLRDRRRLTRTPTGVS